MAEKNLKFEYLSVKKISELTGISERTLRNRCNNNKYAFRYANASGGKNGLKYEILISSLEQELQYQIYSRQGNSCLHGSSDFLFYNHLSEGALKSAYSAPVSLEKQPKVIPDSAKKIALAKFDLILDWEEYRKNATVSKKEADINYVYAYNSGFIAESLYDIIGAVSLGSLYRWKKALKDNNNSYTALINNYNYTGESELNSTLTDSEKQEFIKLYYNDAKLNISTAYNLLKIKFAKQGIEIKSIDTFRRFVKYVRRNHKDFDVLSRKGEKALKDTVAPYNRRDISDINVGDVLVADGNKLDFMVINPYTGKRARAIWVVFFDWQSFDVAGYEIMLTENTQNISSALRNAIIRLGKIPKKVYMDNGRAFRGSYFKGCNDFNQAGFQGVYKNLGIKEVVAKPYNGRSKIVERFFGDFVRTCPPLVASYTGSSISNKPAHLMRNEKFHKELHKNDEIPTIEQAKKIIETWLNEYHRQMPCPHDKSKTIGEMFESGKGQGVDVEMLDELMMSECIRSAKRNTIKLFGLEYECAELYGLEDKFVIKYSLFDISKIKIYSLKGEFIGTAHIVEPVKAFAQDASAVDLYNYKMQQKKYAAMLKGTVDKTRTLIASNPFDDIEFSRIEQQKEIVDLNHKKQKKKLEITLYEDIELTRKAN
ncbi:transposase [bacterium]|nr:transposase [bacterium]